MVDVKYRKQEFIDADYVRDVKVYDEHEIDKFNTLLERASRAFEDIMSMISGYIDVGYYRDSYESFVDNLLVIAVRSALKYEVKELIEEKKGYDFDYDDMCLNVYSKECYVVVEGDKNGVKSIYIRSDILE